MKRLEYRPADASDRVFVIAYDRHRYILTVHGRIVGSVAFDSDSRAGVAEGAVLVLARHHANRLAVPRRRWLRLDLFRPRGERAGAGRPGAAAGVSAGA